MNYPDHWTQEQRELYEEILKHKPKPRPKLAIVSRTELSAKTLRERAQQTEREAAEQERRELAAAKNERQRKLLAFEARHYHAVEEKWHAQQAARYQGFHSRND